MRQEINRAGCCTGMPRTRGFFSGSIIDGMLSSLAEHLLGLPEGLGLDILPHGCLGYIGGHQMCDCLDCSVVAWPPVLPAAPTIRRPLAGLTKSDSDSEAWWTSKLIITAARC